MKTRGIRGATTVTSNNKTEISQATIELFDEMLTANDVKKEDISHIIFTLTEDLNAIFPAKAIREKYHYSDIAMMCYNELNAENSLKNCIRILLVVNTEKEQSEIKFIYKNNARTLRPDIT